MIASIDSRRSNSMTVLAKFAFVALTVSLAVGQQQQQQQQQQSSGSSVNGILSDVTLFLPDAQLTTNGIDINITQLSCSALSVDDVSLQSTPPSEMSVGAVGLRAQCAFQYEYEWSFVSGSGNGVADLDSESTLQVTLQFGVDQDEESGAGLLPNAVNVSNCQSQLLIDNLELDGDGFGLVSSVLNRFEQSVIGVVEQKLAALFCNDMMTDVQDKLTQAMQAVAAKMEPFLQPTASDVADTQQDPLSMEKSAQIPKNNNGTELYVNFQELQFFDQIQSRLASDINSFLEGSVLNEQGLWELEPSLLADSGAMLDSDALNGMNITITSLVIDGLDTLHNSTLLNPIGKYTLYNTFNFKTLTFLMELKTTINASSLSDNIVLDPEATPVTDTFTVEITVSDIHVDLAFFLGINTQSLGNLLLGSILVTDNILPCIRTAVDQANVTQLLVTVSDISQPKVSGFLDDQMNTIVNNGTQAFYQMYQVALLQALPNFLHKTLKDKINDAIAKAEGGDPCPKPDASLDGILDFRDLLLPEEQAIEMQGRGGSPYGDFFRTIYGLLFDLISASDENGMSEWNTLLSQITKAQSQVEGEILFPGTVFQQYLSVNLNGLNVDIDIGVSDVKISNIDTMGAPIELMEPVYGESSVLNNTMKIGVGSDPLRFSLTLSILAVGKEVTIDDEVELGLSLSTFFMMLKFLALVEESPFLNFPMRDIFNINCWLATVVTPVLDKYGLRVGNLTFGMDELVMSVKEAQFDMICISCSSPVLLDMSSYLSSEEGVKDATTTMNNLLSYGSNLLEGAFVQNNFDKILNEAPMQCPHSPEYDENFSSLKYEDLNAPEPEPDSLDFLYAILGVLVSLIVLTVLAIIITRYIVRKRHNRWMKQLNADQIQQLLKEDEYEVERQRDVNKRMKALVFSSDVPLLVRIGIPIVIFGNIALFLSGHISLGGTVNLSGSFAGQEFDVEGFYEFSVVNSTIEMWLAGGKVLAILIALFSGIWPYTKQLVSLFLWFTKPTFFSSRRRGLILQWLDILGKWSMVDVFVLLMMLASFRITIQSPENLNFLPKGLYEINMLVVPLWGLYANMIAQLVSQVSSHIIIHYHRKTISVATRAQEEDWNIEKSTANSDPEILRAHSFKLDYRASNDRAVVRNHVEKGLFVALMVLVILVILGCALPSFNIDILGLLGLAVESGIGFQEAKSHYSVFTLSKMIMDEARYLSDASSYIGLGTLSALLVITVFLVPLAQVVSLFIEWFMAINKKQRHLNNLLNEMLSAWQYMEVFVLSIILTAWQLGGVSEFMINAYCGELDSLFSTIAFFGMVETNDAQCFRVNASVESASWILVSASIMLALLSHFVLTASSQKVLDGKVLNVKRFRNSRLSSRYLTEHTDSVNDIVITKAEEVIEEAQQIRPEKSTISPVPPRFTDYYSFAIRRIEVKDTIAFSNTISGTMDPCDGKMSELSEKEGNTEKSESRSTK